MELQSMEFWRFKTLNLNNHFLLEGEYNYFLVGLSVLISSFAAYALLVILERIWHTQALYTIQLWKIFGSVVFGLGVWAMHFTGMLAFMLPLNDMAYNIPVTILSVVPPMLGAFFASGILAKQQFTFLNMQLSALCLALGIGSMHFLGMEAMLVNALMTYDLGLFIASIGSAHLLAVIAIYLIVYIHNANSHKLTPKLLSALIMGLSIASMHYVAMAAVNFYVDNNTLLSPQHMSNDMVFFGLMITTIVFVIVATTILGAIVDHRLQATELLLQASVTREKDIVEHLADGLIILDQDGNIDSINSMGLKMFGYEKHSLDGCQIKQLMPSLDFIHLSKQGEDAQNLGQNFVEQGIKRTKEPFPIEVNFSAMSMQIQDKNLFNCVIRDISKRVQLEGQLRQAQKLESIGQLAAGIAHEINTPTQYVSDNTSFLKNASQTCLEIVSATQELLNSNNDTEQQQCIEKLRSLIDNGDIDFIREEMPLAIEQSLEGLQRITKIVGAMKSFSHSSDDTMQQVDINEAIESTIIVARSEWRYVAELDTKFDKSLPLVTCLRDGLNQVILNFIVNAAHAIEARYGKSEIHTGLINISTEQEQDNIVILISDNGTGMSEEIQKRIFDPFFTTKGVGKGTGQGLSLAYSVIVETHKGNILIDSAENVGTTFKIILPINRQAANSTSGT
jgi:PAS domain S-box-containing protein